MTTISDKDAWLIDNLAHLLHVALTSDDAFHAGYCCCSAKWFTRDFEDPVIRERTLDLCTAVYRVRRGFTDE